MIAYSDLDQSVVASRQGVTFQHLWQLLHHHPQMREVRRGLIVLEIDLQVAQQVKIELGTVQNDRRALNDALLT